MITTLFWLAVAAVNIAGALLYGLSWRRVSQALLDATSGDMDPEERSAEERWGSRSGQSLRR